MIRSVIIALVVAVGIVAWILSGQFGGSEPPPEATASPAATAASEEALPSVRVRRQQAEPRFEEIVLTGQTQADRKADLKVETAGRVAELAVAKGDVVARGDVILRLQQDDRQARLAEAQAAVEQAEIAFEASRKLGDQGYRARLQVAEDKALLESARAALESIRVEVRNTVVVAPFGGVVEALPVELGDYLDKGEVAATLIDLQPIVVVGRVAEPDITGIEVGDTASVRIGENAETQGTVRFVARSADNLTRTFTIEIAVPNPDGAVSEGRTARIRLVTEEIMAHRASPAVLTLSDEGAVGVKIVDADDDVEFVPVHIIADTAEGVWLAGLPDTITLITVGQEFVIPGQKVRPVPESEIDSAPPPQAPPVPIAERGAS